MPWVYLILTVLAGLFFYWLRRNHLILYGVSELIASFSLMYILYFHMRPDLLGFSHEYRTHIYRYSNEPSGDFLGQRLRLRSWV